MPVSVIARARAQVRVSREGVLSVHGTMARVSAPPGVSAVPPVVDAHGAFLSMFRSFSRGGISPWMALPERKGNGVGGRLRMGVFLGAVHGAVFSAPPGRRALHAERFT